MVASRASQGAVALKNALDRLGWSGNRLAVELGTSSGVVSRWLTGKRAPDRHFAVAIERLTGVSVALWDVDASAKAHPRTLTERKHSSIRAVYTRAGCT